MVGHRLERAELGVTVAPGTPNARDTLLQLSIPDDLRGRVTSLTTLNAGGTSSYRVAFGKAWKRGEWSVTARYLGTVNFKPSRSRTCPTGSGTEPSAGFTSKRP